jgi:hypothetical protein
MKSFSLLKCIRENVLFFEICFIYKIAIIIVTNVVGYSTSYYKVCERLILVFGPTLTSCLAESFILYQK